MIKPKLLFLCTANRCPTQMAEAFLRDLAGGPLRDYALQSGNRAVMPDFPRILAADVAR